MNTSVFSGVKVLSPSNCAIEIFNNSLSSAMNMYLSNMKENVQLALVRDELLPKLLSGELSVDGVGDE
jgi:type I restriction enzyme S subunit